MQQLVINNSRWQIVHVRYEAYFINPNLTLPTFPYNIIHCLYSFTIVFVRSRDQKSRGLWNGNVLRINR